MISKKCNFFLVVCAFLVTSSLLAEDKIDIWKNKNIKNNTELKNKQTIDKSDKSLFNQEKKINQNQKIQIESKLTMTSEDTKVFGVHDPSDFNFNLNMWTSTSADDVRASIKRLKKINLSKTSNDILEDILFSFSYPPKGMNNDEFIKLRINWLIENNRGDLIEKFLKQNQEFDGKSRAVQYLVDQNIAQANITEGCNKIKFIDSTIKDAYLEKFKIYCLVFNKKNSQAQLLLDLLREQKQSDKFFDDKINYLLGITNKTTSKINEANLLNFYLSSVTIKDFEYTPTKKTKREIWKYLNAANLIKLDDVNDKKQINELEEAANQGQVDKKIVFDIYQQISFNLSTLINAKNLYASLEGSESRSLIYQKYLLSEDFGTKVEYLFILDELFKKDNLNSIYSELLSDSLRNIGLENIPESYKELAKKKMLTDQEVNFGKVKYNDKILHQSKIIKYYIENEGEKKTQKDIDKIFKKISKNKKYFYSAKDLALVDTLIKDGFTIPNNFKRDELAAKYVVPKNLLQLIEKKQNAFLALKIVEIIGEDEPHQLDPETIYFITSLLNEMDLIKIRNKVLISALPQRV